MNMPAHVQTRASQTPLPVRHQDMANAIRALAIDAVEQAKSGHPGMPMGMADVATVLFTKFMSFDPQTPAWADRDRFVLSAGHGSMLLYSLLHLTGYPDMTIDELKRFRQLGSKTAGHPEYGHAPGIEVTTGPLGQGLASAVGMALAERLLNARFGDDLVDHYTYVIAGDGCLMEGISHEAIDLAGHLGLSKLIVLFDDNHISIDGPTSLATSTDQPLRFQAAGWSVRSINGHDPQAIEQAIGYERETKKPSLIACRTTIGYGAPNKQGTAATHGAPLGASEVAAARQELGWSYPPFVVPEHILAAWRAAGQRGGAAQQAWAKRLGASTPETSEAFEGAHRRGTSSAVTRATSAAKSAFIAEQPNIATRVSSQKVLEHLADAMPNLVGGSADLTGSNGTRIKKQRVVTRDDFSGDYIHYGVREHAMAAAMNGIALHGGLIPYGGTFLAFADYSRPAIRLGALMGVPVVHAMTHDSIGLGEDGPTHQPVEHLTALRAIPNLLVLRPADAVETAEAWQVALEQTRTPSILCLSRQNLPTLRTEDRVDNLVARGGYVLHEPSWDRAITILATGSEVALACEAVRILAREGIAAAVVSMPCFELFLKQPRDYRRSVLGSAPRIAIEAALRDSWEKFLCEDDVFIGMDGFGASAPAEALYPHFGITSEAIVEAARAIGRSPPAQAA
jgi:transketolase